MILPQKFTVETLTGMTEISAPGDWDFDETAKIVWYRLLLACIHITENYSRKDKCRVDKYVHQIDVLSCLLSDSLGMSPWYWEQQAIQFSQNGVGF